MDVQKMIVDEQLPMYDVVVAKHRIVDADPADPGRRVGLPGWLSLGPLAEFADFNEPG